MSVIAEAKNRHSLAEVARRTGIPVPPGASGSVTVHCPMPDHGHPDRSPSLRLYLADDHYYCLGCGSKGDVVQWASQTERVSITAAIKKLDSGEPLSNAWAGQTSGEQIHRHVGAGAEAPHLERTDRELVLSVLDAAWSYYSRGYRHTRGVEYLAARAIDVTVLERHTARTEIGHTPDSPAGLVAHMRSLGFSVDILVDAGLAYRSVAGDDGHATDFYRERVLMPVRNDGGKVVGIIGRNVGDSRWPKYKNPPRTLAYDKSVNLYQPLSAPTHPDGRVIVVEGTLDAMSIAIAAIRTGQADRYCPVTQSGKELSADQLTTVLGLHPNPPVISFDGDAAGRNSNIRVARRAAAQRGATVAVISLPDGHDPASWLAERGDRGLGVFATDGDDTEPSAPETPNGECPIAPSVPLRPRRRAPVDRSAPSSAHGETFVVDEPAISLA
jgi:DNA primase